MRWSCQRLVWCAAGPLVRWATIFPTARRTIVDDGAASTTAPLPCGSTAAATVALAAADITRHGTTTTKHGMRDAWRLHSNKRHEHCSHASAGARCTSTHLEMRLHFQQRRQCNSNLRVVANHFSRRLGEPRVRLHQLFSARSVQRLRFLVSLGLQLQLQRLQQRSCVVESVLQGLDRAVQHQAPSVTGFETQLSPVLCRGKEHQQTCHTHHVPMVRSTSQASRHRNTTKSAAPTTHTPTLPRRYNLRSSA